LRNIKQICLDFHGGSSGGTYDAVKKKALKLFEDEKIGVLDWNCLTKDAEGSFTKEQLVKNFKKTAKRKE